MKCKNCGKEHNGEYGSGIFCKEKCARSYATKEKREEINKKVSATLKGREKVSSQHNWTQKERSQHSERLLEYHEEKNKNKKFEDLSKIFQRRFLFRKQKGKCAGCGNPFIWRGEPLMQQLHHKDGNDKNRTLKNSELLCPNCHSITDNYMFKNRHHKQGAKEKMAKALALYYGRFV